MARLAATLRAVLQWCPTCADYTPSMPCPNACWGQSMACARCQVHQDCPDAPGADDD